MDFSKSLEAARLIREQGVLVANKSALLVGMSATLAMLFACYDGDDESRLKMLKKNRLDILADLDPLSGRMVIFQEGMTGPVAAFEVRGSRCYKASTTGLNVGMWMQGGGPIISLFGLKAPYREVKSILVREHKKAVAGFM